LTRSNRRVAANLWPDLRPDRNIEAGVRPVTDPSFMRFRAARAAQFRGLNRTASYVLRFEFEGRFSGGARALEPHRARAARGIDALARSASSNRRTRQRRRYLRFRSRRVRRRPDSLARSLAEYFGLQVPLPTRLNRHLGER